jgi:deoxyribodipyrimidine photolyase
MSASLLNALDLPVTIKQRINTASDEKPKEKGPFVLYLPTVVLRKKHNPALALATRIANHLQIPLLIIAVVLDDAHLPQANPKPVAFTARKVAFTLEAIQQAAQEWEAMGAGVAIRVHGPGCRTPHHLTLARTAAVVVLDEPFVHPYLKLTQSVEQCCRSAKVPAFRVDGSTLVPPISKLTRNQNGSYKGVPYKAWEWLKLTGDMRLLQVNGVVNNGHLDAPAVLVKLEPNFFQTTTNTSITASLPVDWLKSGATCPGMRPWTVTELTSISNLKEWTMTCLPSVDTTVPPCQQTHGSARSGMQRWTRFRTNGLHSYERTRNNVKTPHAVSRMSCYLNLGVVSIFTLVNDTWQSKAGGQRKYEDEIIKWREMAYAHAFAYPEYYNRDLAVPAWARKYLSQCPHGGQPMLAGQLETGTTPDATWNAMQKYLVATGELHNNARMTWGKTMVHWQKSGLKLNELLEQLCYINDRYALDGLAPPSYAGLLWCLGWCDKPDSSGRLSEKWASAYRTGPAGFVQATVALLNSQQPSIATVFAQPIAKKQKKDPELGEIKENFCI